MEKELLDKWTAIIAKIKDGKSIKVRRDTVAKGVTKPMGTLAREGNIIKFEPVKSMRRQPESFTIENAPAKLVDIELLSAFFI